MSLYQDLVVSHLVNLAMRNRCLLPYRERVVSAARGRVLEIGIGSGLNLSLYPPAVSEIVGLDPSPRLIEMARRASTRFQPCSTFVEGSGEAIPLAGNSIDTSVMTWTLCSIPDAHLALTEIRRVLKRDGQLLFVEHGRAPEKSVCTWQDRLTPIWKHIAGCHLNRPIQKLIESAGFRMERLTTGYMKGPRPLTFMYEGSAYPL